MSEMTARLEELLTPEWTPARVIARQIASEGWSNSIDAHARVSEYYHRLEKFGLCERRTVTHKLGGRAYTEWRRIL